MASNKTIPIVVAAFALIALPAAQGSHDLLSSTWLDIHDEVDWNPVLVWEYFYHDSNLYVETNLVCLGDAATNMQGSDLLGTVVGASGNSFTLEIDVTGARPECPSSSGSGSITLSLSARFEDHSPSNAQTISGAYTLSGTGFYAGMTGTGQLSASFTGAPDADTGYGTLLDGAAVGSAHN